MRRLLSLVLLAVFSLPLILPALALGQDPESNLPACCRRNGAHHCMMSMQEKAALSQGIQASALRPRCPAYPAVIPPSTQNQLTAPAMVAIRTAGVHTSALNSQTESRVRTVAVRSHPKRGPPSSNIL